MADEPGETVAHCRCDRRYDAMRRGQFVLDQQSGAWYFPDDPPRRVRDSFRLAFYGIESHDGEPFRYSVCPFCGGDLPPIELMPPYELGPDVQADGDDGA